MIYVYAITDRPEQPLPMQLGHHDEALAKVIWQDVAAVVSTFDGVDLSKTAEEVWRHEDVVEALMRDRVALPVRFGTLLPSPRRVGDVLCRGYGALVRDMDRVRGHVEIGLKFLTAAEQSAATGPAAGRPVESRTVCFFGESRPASRLTLSATGPGAAYLSAKVAEERQLQNRHRARLRLVRQVYDQLAISANASRLDDQPDDRQAISDVTSAAFLVPRDRIARFRDKVGEVANAHPELVLLCTGPWPPYSFVNAGERAAGWGEACHAG